MVSDRGKKFKVICSLVILLATAVMLLGGASNSPIQAGELLRAQEVSSIRVSADVVDSDGHGASTDRLISYLLNTTPPHTPSVPSGRDWEGRPGIPYTFSTSATDPDGDQVKYTFDWGDGSTSETGFVDSGTTASASHTWKFTIEALEGKTYYIKAKATDSKGASSGWSEPKALEIVLLYHLCPEFGAFPRSGDAPLTVRFENWSDGGERPYVKAEWDFNKDGVIDVTLTGTDAEVMADVTWTYPLPGVYSVCLTITDSYPPPFGPYAHTDTKIGYITVLFNAWAYDTNDNGVIEKGEAIKAFIGYFDGLITKAQVLEVLLLYFP